MAVVSDPRVSGAGYSAERVVKPPDWHALVAFDMLFNNMTTGLFLVAAAGDLAAPGTFGTAARLAYPVALVLLLADLACLVLDLGHPMRFHHMLRVFKPSSPMSMGTWCLTSYSLPLTLIAAIEAMRALGVPAASWPVAGWVRLLAVVAGIPFALGSAAYKGVLFSTSSQPGWMDSRWLGGYLTNSAIAIGCAEMLAIASIMGQGAAASALRPALVVLLGINLVLLGLVHREVGGAMMSVERGERLMTLTDLGGGAGGLVPIPLLLLGGGVAIVLSSLALILSGHFLVRWAIVMLPHHAPGDAMLDNRGGRT